MTTIVQPEYVQNKLVLVHPAIGLASRGLDGVQFGVHFERKTTQLSGPHGCV
jgi:hypothetical protein